MSWLQQFENDGYCVLRNFCSKEEVNIMKGAISKIADDMDVTTASKSVFNTYDKAVYNTYFLESVDKISFFYEKEALDSEGNIKISKETALNKIGHALHNLDPSFHKISFSNRVIDVSKTIGFVDPVIPQSMYIFKQSKIGGEVGPHIDATFLICHPPQFVVGMWIAVDNATIENGCLWFAPGSHKKTKVDKRLVRTTDSDGHIQVQMEGEDIPPASSDFIPVPIQSGDCILIHGLVWHKSEANRSNKARHAYTFHIFDRGSAKWNEKSWLQETNAYSFPKLYANK